ncbi:uncharacterized protein LOC120715434 [Simochromis diagramma]|uniref:uncharacterized protein LOC120715434 n=1 Tax=Simochromis diagramma TaxID=43689 RepID=UPI001A7EAF50|nr:uncharacterized protein LOC120715434 [Simochromis diagramma]
MKTAPLLLGVCVLLLSAPTVSAVSLSVSPNLQQVFKGSSVSLSCVDDGQTADGWTVKRTRGGPTEDCGAAAASSFGQFNSSSCMLSPLTQSDSAAYWCETSSGQSDQINITVTVKGVILLIPALPVWTGSDVTLQCSNGKTAAAYFFIKGSPLEHNPKPKHSLTKVQKSDEGFYSCSTNEDGKSPESSLRVRDPPPVSSPPQTSPSSSPPLTSTLSIHPPTFSHPHAPPPSSILVPVVAGLGSVVLLVLVLVGVLSFCRKPKGGRGAELWSCGGDGCLTRSVCLCFSGLFLLTAAGVCVLLLSALAVSTAPPLPPFESLLRLFCHLVVFCPYCISTGLLLYIRRKALNRPAVSMEMTQHDGGGQRLEEECDDDTVDVTTEHAF